MCKGVRNDVTLRLSLQSIITDRGRGLHGCLNVTWLDKLPFLLGAICPDAGQAVRLQFYTDLQAVGLRLVHPTLLLLHLGQNLRDHIGVRELTGFAALIAPMKTPLEVLEEARVEMHRLVNGAIERT